MKTCAASLIVLGLGLGCVSNADADDVPTMTIKIFNDDTHYIFPVLTTGQGGLNPDIWLQAFFKVPNDQIAIQTYLRTKSYRIYINPTTGIAPGRNVSITVPLYTQLVASPTSPYNDQYIDWWNGGTIQVFTNTKSTPPRALTDDLTNRPNQQPVGQVFSDLPACAGDCLFFSDNADLPKNDPSQLLEYTLGARVAQLVVNNSPPNALDLKNVDFDVSYVNLAFAPAAMGPYQNDQVGYVGTPQKIATFAAALNKFLTDFPGWPQFVRTYPTHPTRKTLLKLPSPLEIFSRLAPGALAPPDLTPAPDWPTQLWLPIEALRKNWIKYAGTVSPVVKAGSCQATSSGDTFCDAIIDAKKLMLANFTHYQKIFGTQCNGTPITLTDDKMISHVYGWAPFTEAASGTGCPATANLLENTPGGYKDNNYAEYSRIKLEFDKLNYGPNIKAPLKNPKYVFNPWVVLIHGSQYVNAPNVYAYSVDDAVGNIQAYGTGFIVDIGSTVHLENQNPAAPPINIAYAIGDQKIKFTNFRICINDLDHDRPVNPAFQSFVISANNPATCPIFFLDNKVPPQLYSFTITKPPPFTFFPDPDKPPFPMWTENTAAVIDCTADAGPAPYQPSSKNWCCEKLNPPNGNGVFAYSKPEPHNAHQSEIHTAVTHIAEQLTTNPNLNTCNMGQ